MFVFGWYLPLFVVPPKSTRDLTDLSWWLPCWDSDSFQMEKNLGKCEHTPVEGGFSVVLPQISAMMITHWKLKCKYCFTCVFIFNCVSYMQYYVYYLVVASLRYTCHFLSFAFLFWLGRHAIAQSIPHWTAVKQAPCNWKTNHHHKFFWEVIMNLPKIQQHLTSLYLGLSFYPSIRSI